LFHLQIFQVFGDENCSKTSGIKRSRLMLAEC